MGEPIILSVICCPCAVGYGDKAPVTLLGRLLGVTWMFVGVLLVGYFSSMMLEGYIDPPPRYDKYQTWMDLMKLGDTTKPFCTQTDPFFISTLLQQRLVPSEQFPDDRETVIFKDSMTECYELLLNEEVRNRAAHPPSREYVCVCVCGWQRMCRSWETGREMMQETNCLRCVRR